MNFSQGHSGTQVRYVNRACFPKEKHQNSQKMGEIHELFVLALSLVWFAGATPEVLHFSGPMKSGHFPWNCPPQFQGKSRKGHDV